MVGVTWCVRVRDWNTRVVCVRACGMLKQVQELQKYLKDKKIPSWRKKGSRAQGEDAPG